MATPKKTAGGAADKHPEHGLAVFIADHENGTDEWHELRRSGIGGSEVGTICGLNRWESPLTLWAKKTGRIDDQIEPSEAMEWGNRLEGVIIDKFADEHPDLTIWRSPGTFHHVERVWQRANPDGIFFDGSEYGIIEVKTAQFEEDWTEGVPRYYETQVQWYLDVFGFEKAFVIVLFHGNRYREFEVKASTFQQEQNLAEVIRFRTYLEGDIQPDYDGSNSTLTTVRALHPEIEPDAEEEVGWLGVEYFDAAAAYAEAEARLNEMKARVLDAMGNAKKGLIDGEVAFTRQARGSGTPYLVVKRGVS